MKRFAIAMLVFSLAASAQTRSAKIQVRLTYADGSVFQPSDGNESIDADKRSGGGQTHVSGGANALQIRVQVQDGFGTVVGDRSPSSDGKVEFTVVIATSSRTNALTSTPTYRIRVFGPTIEETVVDGVDPFHGERMIDVAVRPKGEAPKLKAGGNATVSLSRLAVPDKASKELDRGNSALREQNYSTAEEHFRRAIDIFPEFDQAYNNLGVIMMQRNKPDEARKYFNKAISINDKFARAYTNLGKLEVLQTRYDAGDMALRKALQTDPTNPETLMLAAECALFTGKLEDAVNDARVMHSIPHDSFGFGHFVAGRAFEQLHRPSDAIAEYRLFLKESPSSPNVANAKASIARLQGQ